MRVSRPVVLILLAGSAAALNLTSCSTSPSAVSKTDVEKQVTEQLTKTVGTKPDSVTCPGDLTATVGTTMRCTLTAGATNGGLTVTVTSVNDAAAKFDIKVDDATTPTSVTTAAP